MTDIALREFLEKQICALDKRIDQRFIALDKALALQAGKDKEHFDALNHEQARLLADRERYLPREIYLADNKNKMDKIALIISMVSVITSIATFLLVLPK